MTSDDRSNAARSRIFCCRIQESEIVQMRATAVVCSSADCRKRPQGSGCWTNTSRHRSNSTSPAPGSSVGEAPGEVRMKRGPNSAPEFRARGIAFRRKSQQVFTRGFHLAPNSRTRVSYQGIARAMPFFIDIRRPFSCWASTSDLFRSPPVNFLLRRAFFAGSLRTATLLQDYTGNRNHRFSRPPLIHSFLRMSGYDVAGFIGFVRVRGFA